MKKQNLKNITAGLFFTLAFLGSSTVSTAQVIEHTVAKTEAILTSRYTGGNYLTASYSFKFASQDISVTKNNTEIIFEGRKDSKDYFNVRMSADDHSLIFDLGKGSCKNLKRSAAGLDFLKAKTSKLVPAIAAEVKVDHCYLTYNTDESGHSITIFHVAEHKKSYSVKINEIKVLEKTFSN